jgi:preprotein translocase subunit SecD
LGSNFFRSLKYSFVYTGLVLTALFIGFLLLLPSGSYQTGFTLGSMVKQHGIVIGCIGILLSIANVMAAYRLFGHRPLIGRFINPL